jgi:penicillin amidase
MSSRRRLLFRRRSQVWGPLAALGLGGVGYAWRRLRRRAAPPTGGSFTLAGLRQAAEVIRDRWGIPHIYAQTEEDLFFAQGFVHAQDRLFQMDAHRRVGLGRISEIVGPAGLPSDRFARIFGWPRAAAAQVEGILHEPDVLAMAEAYRDGVNAFMAQRQWPVEYALLAFRPQPWRILDSAAWGTVLAWGLSVNWETELMRVALIEQLGPAKADDLTPAYHDTYPTILPDSRVGARLAAAMIKAYSDVVEYLPLGEIPAGPGIGSNNWVVNGQWTESGRPILANDPHLPPVFPTLWYENHLVGGRYNVTGFTMAGVPGVIIGHNEQVAWGITNAFPDVQDVYIERFHPDDPGRYEVDGQWVAAEITQETIRVRGRPAVTEQVIYTRHGPVISSLIPGEKRALSLRWIGHDPANHVQALLETNRATDWASFRAGLRHWGFPSQNVVYADTAGNIGYTMPGVVPIRAGGEGLLPAPGWLSGYEWSGRIPFEELPVRHNPPEGMIVTANNCVAGDGYPHLLTSEWLPSFRADRITELLKAIPQQTIAGHQQVQMDTVSVLARRFLVTARPLLEQARPDHPALALLHDWDGDMRADSPAATLYFSLIVHLIHAVFHDNPALSPLAELLLGRGQRAEYPNNPFHEMAYELVVRWLEQGTPAWIGEVAARLPAAFDQTIAALRQQLGSEPAGWQWGKLHRIHFRHPLARVPGLGRLWKPLTVPAGGDGHSVNQADLTPHFPPEPVHIIASCRFILDVGQWDNSVSALPGGQSGHLGSPHYQDSLHDWLAGRYHPMLFSREKVEGAAESHLLLHPAEP